MKSIAKLYAEWKSEDFAGKLMGIGLFISLVLIAALVVALPFAIIDSLSACERSCEAFDAVKVTESKYGCICERDGERFVLQEEAEHTVTPVVIPQ